MRKASKLRKAREACNLRGHEIAAILDMSVVRYMTIEMEWKGEEPTQEEMRKLCRFFKMGPQELGFGSDQTMIL